VIGFGTTVQTTDESICLAGSQAVDRLASPEVYLVLVMPWWRLELQSGARPFECRSDADPQIAHAQNSNEKLRVRRPPIIHLPLARSRSPMVERVIYFGSNASAMVRKSVSPEKGRRTRFPFRVWQ
jgi:hypothetical protein